MGLSGSKKQKPIAVKSVQNIVIQDHDVTDDVLTDTYKPPREVGGGVRDNPRDVITATHVTSRPSTQITDYKTPDNNSVDTAHHSPSMFSRPSNDKENSFVEPKKFTIGPSKADRNSTPLKYDRTNTTTRTNTTNNSPQYAATTPQYAATIPQYATPQQPPVSFNLSQNYYQTPGSNSQPPATRFSSYSNPRSGNNEHHSGVYNRHGNIPASKPKSVSDPNVLSLLKKDKFTLLGSHLQQEESKIFLKHSNVGSSNGTHPPLNSTSNTTPSSFDPNRFRAANENKKNELFRNNDHELFKTQTFRQTNEHVVSQIKPGLRRNSRLTNPTTVGPLDDGDEELISSIEKEFDFPY